MDVASTYHQEKSAIQKELLKFDYDYIYSSPLIRCLKLAKDLAREKGINYVADSRLKELNFGKWEMGCWSKISETKEAKWWFEDYINRPCPEGESYPELVKRVEGFYRDIEKTGYQNSPLIVTHGGVIKAFYVVLKKMGMEDAMSLKHSFGELIAINT